MPEQADTPLLPDHGPRTAQNWFSGDGVYLNIFTRNSRWLMSSCYPFCPAMSRNIKERHTSGYEACKLMPHCQSPTSKTGAWCNSISPEMGHLADISHMTLHLQWHCQLKSGVADVDWLGLRTGQEWLHYLIISIALGSGEGEPTHFTSAELRLMG